MLVSSEAEERNNRSISVRSNGKREGGGEENGERRGEERRGEQSGFPFQPIPLN